MAFKETAPEFQMIDVEMLDCHPDHSRCYIDQVALESLANSIRRKGIIQPLVVFPADASGRYKVIVGERRRRAAILAGEAKVPVLIRACDSDELLAIQVFENMGGGLRAPLESRDMSRAIQRIADSFETSVEAAEELGRKAAWVTQATAAANLSPRVNALLEVGKISSAGTAVRLEKLSKKNSEKAERLIVAAERMAEGETLSRKVVENEFLKEKARPSVDAEVRVESGAVLVEVESPEVVALRETPVVRSVVHVPRVSTDKVRQVAALLGLAGESEEDVFARLVDEFLALKAGGRADGAEGGV